MEITASIDRHWVIRTRIARARSFGLTLLLTALAVGPGAAGALDEHARGQIELGKQAFHTQAVGVGPLFNATSCDACHAEGAGGHGPTQPGPLPVTVEIQLETPSARPGDPVRGDPVYGRVFNTAAVDNVRPEGVATVRYDEIDGYYYPDGTRWHLRVPHYQLLALNYGPLSPTTVIEPRLAPALFGVGLLEAVPQLALGTDAAGRFGWQATARSIRDQTSKAFAQEMGLTSADRPNDDCTSAQTSCLQAHTGRPQKVSDELLEAIVAFQKTLAVPPAEISAEHDSRGLQLFAQLGCDSCHRPQLPVALADRAGATANSVIAPYTDLRLHDMGPDMADENVSGVRVRSKWRTPPLWGLGYRIQTTSFPTFLHDGRARSVEEAILWHAGEASPSRRRFMSLWRQQRETLLHWVETL